MAAGLEACVAVCGSVWQCRCVAVCVAVCGGAWQCVRVFGSVCAASVAGVASSKHAGKHKPSVSRRFS